MMQPTRRGLLALLGGAVGALTLGLLGRYADPVPQGPVVDEATRQPFTNNSLVQWYGDIFPQIGASSEGDIFFCTWPGSEGIYMCHGGGRWELMREAPHLDVSAEELLKIRMSEPQVCGHLQWGCEGGPIDYSGTTAAVQHRATHTADEAEFQEHNRQHAARMRRHAARADRAIAAEVRKSCPKTERELEACRDRALQKLGVVP